MFSTSSKWIFNYIKWMRLILCLMRKNIIWSNQEQIKSLTFYVSWFVCGTSSSSKLDSFFFLFSSSFIWNWWIWSGGIRSTILWKGSKWPRFLKEYEAKKHHLFKKKNQGIIKLLFIVINELPSTYSAKRNANEDAVCLRPRTSDD